MSDDFFFDESNPNCRLPEVPRPPVDFVPECFITPPPPLIFECFIPIPPPDPPAIRCPEFETTTELDVFYEDEDEECEERKTNIEFKITKTNDDPCKFDVDLNIQIGIPRPPCPTTKSEHKTHVGYEECVDCIYVGSVGSAAQVAGLTEDSFPIPPEPIPPEDENAQAPAPPRKIFVALDKVVTQVSYNGSTFVPHFSEQPFASVEDLLAAGGGLGNTPGAVSGVAPFFKRTGGKWVPMRAPVEKATVNTFAELATIPLSDAPAGTVLRVKDSSLYERKENGSWAVVTFNPIDFTDAETGDLLTLNDLLNSQNPFPAETVVRVKLTGNTFSVVAGQLVEVEKEEPNDWVFEEADLPAYLAARLATGASLAPGTIIGVAFPTDRYELTDIRTGGDNKRKTWAPARCKQNKFVFVVAKPKDCADKEAGCRLFLFTEITVPIPRTPCPEFNIREFEINTYINRGNDDEGNNLCQTKKPKFEIEKRPNDPNCDTPGQCEFDIDLVIDIPIPEVPCPEITSGGLTVNTFFIAEDVEPGEDPDTCCPLPENVIEVADYAALLALTRRQADVGSFARQLDNEKLWERIGPLLYEDLNGDDDFENIDDPSPETAPGTPADWRLAEPCGSRLSIKTIKKGGTCEKHPECKFDVDLRINVPIPRMPCPEISISEPRVNVGLEDSPCVNCISDLTVDTVEQLYAIPRENRNYGMFVTVKVVANSFSVGENNELIPIGFVPPEPEFEFESWDQVPGGGGEVPPSYTDDGDLIEEVPPWEREEGDPPRIQNGTVIYINSPPPPSLYIYVAETGWAALPAAPNEADTTVDTEEEIGDLPPEDREEGDVINVENPVTRYKLERDMETWTPAPCPKNKFGVTVVSEPPKDCRDPGKCELTLEFEINVPVPKQPCPQINVRDFTVSTYPEDDEECPLEERPECASEPEASVSGVSELDDIEAEDGMVVQVGQGTAGGELYRYDAEAAAWLRFVPTNEERKNCCAFSITKRNTSNQAVQTVDTVADLNALRIPEDVAPGGVVIVLYPPEDPAPDEPEPEDPSAPRPPGDPENTQPWYFRAGEPPAGGWARLESFDPCAPPPEECSFDVDLNICIPIPTVPCPETKSESKTHVGYEDEECVNCEIDTEVGTFEEISDLDIARLRPPAPPRNCASDCAQFSEDEEEAEEEGAEAAEDFYIGVQLVASQFTYTAAGFAPSFFERGFSSFTDFSNSGAPAGPFRIDGVPPFFELVGGRWVPVLPPTASATVGSLSARNNLTEAAAPPGTIIGVTGGGLFERRPNGSWREIVFNPTPCDRSLPDLVNGNGCEVGPGGIIQIPVDPDAYYNIGADGLMAEVDRPKPDDWAFDEESLTAYLTERAADNNPVSVGEIIEVAFPTDRYRLSVSTGENGDPVGSVSPARCKKNAAILGVAKNCAKNQCKLFLFTEVTVQIPRPPCPSFSTKAKARGFYVNDEGDPCGGCGSDLQYETREELVDAGPIGNGKISEDACRTEIEPGTTASIKPNEETGEPGSRWRWNPDYGGWQPAPCGESFFSFKKAKSPDLSKAASKPTKSALCDDADAGEIYYIEETGEYYEMPESGSWRKVSPDDCTESSCNFDVDIDLAVAVPQPPCPVFNTRKADVRACGDFPRGGITIATRESKCETDKESQEKQCVFDIDFDVEIPCPKFNGGGALVNMAAGAAGGNVNFTKSCAKVEPPNACGNADFAVVDALARDEKALEMIDSEEGLEVGAIFETAHPEPRGAQWRWLGIENGELLWEGIICDPLPQDVCEFDVDLSIDIPGCEKIEFAEDDDAGTSTGIAKADRYKHYYLKSDDDCPPDPDGDPCVDRDAPDIQVPDAAAAERLLGEKPGNIRDMRAGDGVTATEKNRQLRAGMVFKEPIMLNGAPSLDADGNQMFNYARLDASPFPSRQLTKTAIQLADVPKNSAGGPVALSTNNFDVQTLDGLDARLGTPPDPRLVDGAAVKVGQGDAAPIFQVKNGAIVPANICGDPLLKFVIVPELQFANPPQLDANGNLLKVPVPCKYRYAAQIRICERMPDHNAPCTKYHGNPCCDTGCSACGAEQDNPCCDDENKAKEADGHDSESPGAAAEFRALPQALPRLQSAGSSGGTNGGAGADPDAPSNPCEEYNAAQSANCGPEPDDPGYRPFKSLELNIKENFPEDRLSPPKITYQLDAAPNCLHGGAVKIVTGKRPAEGGDGGTTGGTTADFTAMPADATNPAKISADLPTLRSSAGGTGTGTFESCVNKATGAPSIGSGTIEIVNNKINLCITLYTDECEDDSDSGGGSGGSGSSGGTTAEFTALPPSADNTATLHATDSPPAVQRMLSQKRQAQHTESGRLTATLLEDLISAINTHPELKEAIRNVVNQPD